MADLSTEGPFAHAREPIRLATIWVDRWRNGPPPRKGLYFHGPNGTGKTSVASAIAIELEDATFWAVRDLIATAKSEFGCDVRWPVVEKCVRASLLILDDVGVMRNTAYVTETVQDIIARRYDREGLTILTSNFAPDAIRVIVGDACHSRLMGSTAPVQMTTSDLRLAPA